MRLILLVILAALASVVGLPREGFANKSGCLEGGVCTLPSGRTYRLSLPATWKPGADTSLPVVIHFHGWGRTARHVMRNRRLVPAAHEVGAVIVAPDGIDGSWSFRNPETRDVLMTDELVSNLAQRIKIDPKRIVLSGFSYGGEIVSRIACDRGGRYHAYLPIAGGPPRHKPENCRGGPARVVHVHGVRDTVLPAPIGEPGRNDDDFAFWRQVSRCAPTVDRSAKVGKWSCRWWRDCAPGAELTLCLSRAQHELPKRWLGIALKWVLGEETNG